MTVTKRPSGSVSTSNEEDLRLGPETRGRLVAVVVDANAYGEVGPDLARMANLAADLTKIGLRLWVPEPVAWEWAEHLASEWIAVRTFSRKRLGYLEKAGLAAAAITHSYGERDDVIDSFLQVLTATPHVEIVALTGKSAIEGLKDQVLQRPPAKTKSDEVVKTGGSDSAWIRDVLDKAGAPDGVLFLSRDKDIKNAYRAWGHSEPLMRNPETVRASLFHDVPASIEDQWLVARYLFTRMPVPLDALGAEGQLIGTTKLSDNIDLGWEDRGWTGGSLTRLLGLAGLTDVVCEAEELFEPGRARKHRVIRATAYFLATAEVTQVASFGEGEAVREHTTIYPDLVARTRLVLTIEGNQVVKVRPDSETYVFSADRYDDIWDAAFGIADALQLVPGLRMPQGWEGWWQDAKKHQVSVEGTAGQVVLSWSFEGDELSVSVGDAEASVVFGFDENARGTEAFYVVTSAEPEIDEGALPLACWVIGALIQQDEDVRK